MLDKRTNDRRKVEVDYRRRTMDRREHKFYYERVIYLTDTNAYGNMYFAQYFDIIGEAREELLRFILGLNLEQFMQSQVSFLTVDSSIKYRKPFYLFDTVRVEVKVEKLTKMKIFLKFLLLENKTRNLHAEAKMTLAVLDKGQPIRIPEIIGEGLEPFMRDE